MTVVHGRGVSLMEQKNEDSNVVVRLEHLTRRFGDFTAVSDLTLDIRAGQIVGLLGPNGAGKSTTMKMMAYLIRPSEGSIYVRRNGTLQRLTNGNKDTLLDEFGFLIEAPAFYDDVTPRQILEHFARLRGYPRKAVRQRVEEVMTMMGLAEWIDEKINTFSKGMRQKVGILSTIVHDPQVLVLDEPSSGLDPRAQVEIRDFFQQLKAMGKTIFLSSHLLYEISEVADIVAILNHGQLVACDTVNSLETQFKNAVIRLELHPRPETAEQQADMSCRLAQLVAPLTGLPQEKNQLRYNTSVGVFEIPFDGNIEHQAQIHKALVAGNYNIVEFSVPRASKLEDLYISLVEDGGDVGY